MYPKVLVFLQFSLIGLMLFFSNGFSIFFSDATAPSVFVMGLSIGLWALNHNQLGNFNIQPKMKEHARLVTTGIYGLIRHPMYTSVIVMMFSVLISTFISIEIVLFITLILVLLLKAHKEESLWIAQNKDYQHYKEKTKYFIPYIL